MRVEVLRDMAGRETELVYEFEGNGNNSTYPTDPLVRTKVITVLTEALKHLLRLRKGLLDGEI